MAEIVNLRQVRKARKRDDAVKQADANRARFGRTKAQKLADRAEQARLDRTVDGARLDNAQPPRDKS